MPWDFWLIFLILGVVLPSRGRHRMRHLMSLPEVTGRDRIKLYVSTILFQWALAVTVCWRALARGLTPPALGLTTGQSSSVVLAAITGAAVIGIAHWLNLRRMAHAKHPAAESLRAMGARLFPRSAVELGFYILLAITAALCEEFLFRGFVIAALFQVGFSTWIVVICSSFMFGAAHLYQGKGGSIGTGILGTLFAGVTIAYHSLLPVIVWHAVLDIVAGIAGSRYLVAEAREKPDLSGVQQ
jgi:membrane protease YdiL (CAAX protease family)